MQTVINGNSLEVLPTLEADSVDSVVCDPPYELGFMGKSWDSTGIAYNVQLWREVLRVLNPGGHLLAFGGSRTFHRLACAIEDAGFEIRDQLLWIYGSGFPKSLDISKAIDKQVIGDQSITAPATPAAIQWQGWGTALKPAHEPICMARKPFKGTVADNVLQHGTGGLNVDAGRIETGDNLNGGAYAKESTKDMSNRHTVSLGGTGKEFEQPSGRFPSNLLLSETAAQDLDESTGQLTPSVGKAYSGIRPHGIFSPLAGVSRERSGERHGDSGGPSRFFYVAKASKREREAGLSGFDDVVECMANNGKSVNASATQDIGLNRAIAIKNNHPTVKPIKLMEYLVKLVTPPNGIVLDPFTGSGSTGCACARLGFEFIGIELEPKYKEIAEARIKHFACELA